MATSSTNCLERSESPRRMTGPPINLNEAKSSEEETDQSNNSIEARGLKGRLVNQLPQTKRGALKKGPVHQLPRTKREAQKKRSVHQ